MNSARRTSNARLRRPAPIALLVLIVLAFLAARGPLRTQLWPESTRAPHGATPVAEHEARAQDVIVAVSDGDTVVGRTYGKIRLLGLDTPEREQPLYDEARTALARLVEGKKIELLFDRERKDKYGRTLAHILVPDGDKKTIAAEELLRAGLASVYIVQPDMLFIERFKAAQKEAVTARRGLWSLPVDSPEAYYIVSSAKFHRPTCRFAAQIPSPRKATDRRALLAEGKSPCRECRP